MHTGCTFTHRFFPYNMTRLPLTSKPSSRTCNLPVTGGSCSRDVTLSGEQGDVTVTLGRLSRHPPDSFRGSKPPPPT